MSTQSYWELRDNVKALVKTPEWLNAYEDTDKRPMAILVQDAALDLFERMRLERDHQVAFGSRTSPDVGRQDTAIKRLSRAYVDSGLAPGESSALELAKGLQRDISTLMIEKLGPVLS